MDSNPKYKNYVIVEKYSHLQTNKYLAIKTQNDTIKYTEVGNESS